MALVEKSFDTYNEALAADIERLERPSIETGGGQDESPLTIDPAVLIENVHGVAKKQVAYLVDMANGRGVGAIG